MHLKTPSSGYRPFCPGLHDSGRLSYGQSVPDRPISYRPHCLLIAPDSLRLEAALYLSESQPAGRNMAWTQPFFILRAPTGTLLIYFLPGNHYIRSYWKTKTKNMHGNARMCFGEMRGDRQPLRSTYMIDGIRYERYHGNGPLTRYVKLHVAHAPGMSGTFSPAVDFKGNR